MATFHNLSSKDIVYFGTYLASGANNLCPTYGGCHQGKPCNDMAVIKVPAYTTSAPLNACFVLSDAFHNTCLFPPSARNSYALPAGSSSFIPQGVTCVTGARQRYWETQLPHSQFQDLYVKESPDQSCFCFIDKQYEHQCDEFCN